MKSLVAPYSLRATAVPLVSTPVRWDEVEAALAAGQPSALRFGPEAITARLARDGDLFRAVIDLEQRLPQRA